MAEQQRAQAAGERPTLAHGAGGGVPPKYMPLLGLQAGQARWDALLLAASPPLTEQSTWAAVVPPLPVPAAEIHAAQQMLAPPSGTQQLREPTWQAPPMPTPEQQLPWAISAGRPPAPAPAPAPQQLPGAVSAEQPPAPAPAPAPQQPPAPALAAEPAEPPEVLCCPITLVLLEEAVVASDGHTYSRAAIEDWLEQNRTSPLTGEELSSLVLTPNHLGRCFVREWQEKHGV